MERNIIFLICFLVGLSSFAQNSGVKFPSGAAAGGTDSQTLSFANPTLSITNGNGVNISGVNTDAQTLSFANPNLSITGGNSVDLSALSGGGGSGVNWSYANTDTLKFWLDTTSWKCQGYILKQYNLGWHPVAFYNPISQRWARDSQIVLLNSGQSNMNMSTTGAVTDSNVVYWNHLTGAQSLTVHTGTGVYFASELSKMTGRNVVFFHINQGATDIQQWFLDSLLSDSIITYVGAQGCPATTFFWWQGENNTSEARNYDSLFYRVTSVLQDSGIITRATKKLAVQIKQKTNNLGFGNEIRQWQTRYPDPYLGGVLYYHSLGIDPANVHFEETEKDSIARFAYGVWRSLPRPIIQESIWMDGEENLTTVELPYVTQQSLNNVILNADRDTILLTSGQENFLAVRAGQSLTTGDDNILIGSDAGLGITTGNGNVIIGGGNAPNVANRSDQIIIGRNNLTGTISGTRNEDFIIGNNNFANTTHTKLMGFGDLCVSDESSQIVFSPQFNSLKMGAMKFDIATTPTTGQRLVYHSTGEFRPETPAYAEIYTSATMSFSASGAWEHIQDTDWASGYLQGFTRTDSTLTYTGTITKKFGVQCHCSANSTTAGLDITFTVADNNTRLTKIQNQVEMEFSTSYYSTSWGGIIELAQNETFDIRMKSSAAATVNIAYLNCSLKQLD